jgi:hypothetical protein
MRRLEGLLHLLAELFVGTCAISALWLCLWFLDGVKRSLTLGPPSAPPPGIPDTLDPSLLSAWLIWGAEIVHLLCITLLLIVVLLFPTVKFVRALIARDNDQDE